MSQQFLTQYAPMVKTTDIKMIPVAAIGGQTREGKDEIITGAGNMVFVPTIGENGMWVPVSEENPLPVALSGRIADIANKRPSANAVPVGTVYWSVDTGDVSVSTGTSWRSLGVA